MWPHCQITGCGLVLCKPLSVINAHSVQICEQSCYHRQCQPEVVAAAGFIPLHFLFMFFAFIISFLKMFDFYKTYDTLVLVKNKNPSEVFYHPVSRQTVSLI